MCYDIGVIKKENHKVNNWSGGTTTELLIYPRDAVYAERNFKWRISSAKVEAEESIFTSLPGISRIIMIIDGKIKLEHENHHNVVLNKFEQDEFMGEWKTKSYGKVTDFNLMMSKDCSGNLKVLNIKSGEQKEYLSENDIKKLGHYSKTTEVFYCVNGEIEILCHDEESLNISSGDLLYITKEVTSSKYLLKFKNSGTKECSIIKSVVYY